jgi:CBS-domain-containing membrane protein
MLAKDVMTTKVITVSEDTPVEELVRTLLVWRISAVPIVDVNDQLVGMVSEGDLVHRVDSGVHEGYSWWLADMIEPEQRAQRYAKARGHLARDVMSTPVITADEDDSLPKVATMLEEYRIKRVPILRKGKLTGIVSRANLLHGLAASPKSLGEEASPTKSPAPDDRSIRATILSRLHNDVEIAGAINVIVSQGVVDLWGGVETEAERQTIRVVAENAPGVSAVNDHLSVLPRTIRHLLGADKSD